MNKLANPAIFCAVDTNDIEHALALAAAMQRAGCGIKLGLEFYNAFGPQGVKEIRTAYPELPVFLDLKYHDIPNTVAGAIRAAALLEPDYITLHVTGGMAMMKAAVEALRQERDPDGARHTKILGVTLLTSLDEEQLEAIGMKAGIEERAGQLARLARQAGLDGVVCSPHEIEHIRTLCGPDFILMVPGIRPDGVEKGDQKRVMTPTEAAGKGATHLVIGRPINQSDDPAGTATSIMNYINAEAA